ncbi:proline racemase [Paratrimastix pyriformis]|uniref:Proline racemase n=1 Tax=Paratrimastix pyriformis TaxID=342808 RepID=A0ABQ8UFX5_9EUKA|nr:proline racemase [Paratrimastix pyriformis]
MSSPVVPPATPVLDLLLSHSSESYTERTHAGVFPTRDRSSVDQKQLFAGAEEGLVVAVVSPPTPGSGADLTIQYLAPKSRLEFCGHATLGFLYHLIHVARQDFVSVILEVPSAKCVMRGTASKPAGAHAVTASFLGPPTRASTAGTLILTLPTRIVELMRRVAGAYFNPALSARGNIIEMNVATCGGNIFLDVPFAQLFCVDGLPATDAFFTAATVPFLTEVALVLREFAATVPSVKTATESVWSSATAGAAPPLLLMFYHFHTATEGHSFVLYDEREVDRTPCGSGGSALAAVLHQRAGMQVGQSYTLRSPFGVAFEYTLVEATADQVRVRVQTDLPC